MSRSSLLPLSLSIAVVACRAVPPEDAVEDPSCSAQLLYADADGDGFGDPATAQQACPQPGLTDIASDCDDTDGARFPGAEEIACNGQIDDCALERESEVYVRDGEDLQAGIDEAAPEGIVCVSAGTYDPVRISGQDVRGVDGRSETVISAGRSSTAVSIDSGSLTEFTVQGGAVGVDASDAEGVHLSGLAIQGSTLGASVASASDVVLDDVAFVLVDAGMSVSDTSELVLESVSFYQASTSGGAYALELDSVVGFTGQWLDFEQCAGGAMSIVDSEDVAIAGSLFRDNTASSGAGITAAYSSGLTIEDSAFTGNTATMGGAVSLYSMDRTEITSSILEENAAVWGGAMYVDASRLDLTDCSINENTAADTNGWPGVGGGLFGKGAQVLGQGNTWSGNFAGTWGGAVLVTGSDAQFDDRFEQNDAGDSGGAIYAIACDIVTTNAEFSDNQPEDVTQA